MALLDWPMTLIGYPAHRRCGVPVVGVSHMTTHQALRFAEATGMFTGWILADGPAPQVEGILPDTPTWVALAEFFVERRVAYTEGMVSGSLVFASAVPADGRPPADRSLATWAAGQGKPWVEVVDNELAYWGGLDNARMEALLRWFIASRPLDRDWRETVLEPQTASELRAGLFHTGLTRNLALTRAGRKPSVDLWGGVHHRCMLDHESLPPPSAVGNGWRLALRGTTWQARPLEGISPLDDERARITPPVER